MFLGLNDVAFLAAAAGEAALWTPANITTALWLDAADASTITESGGAVSQWNDKSGNGRNATQGTVNRRPVVTANGLASKSVITFDGTDDFMDVVTTVFQGIGNFQVHWIYAMLGAGSGSNAYRPAISLLSETVPAADRGALHYIKNENNLGASYPFVGATAPSWGNYDLLTGTTYANNQANLLSFNAGASSWAVFRNGSQEGTAARGGSIGGDLNGVRLAQQANPLRTSNIYTAEIVMVTNADTAERQRIEGYLAHKWGLTANLPNDHPYKTAAPTL
jgi:hypothetical protein